TRSRRGALRWLLRSLQRTYRLDAWRIPRGSFSRVWHRCGTAGIREGAAQAAGRDAASAGRGSAVQQPLPQHPSLLGRYLGEASAELSALLGRQLAEAAIHVEHALALPRRQVVEREEALAQDGALAIVERAPALQPLAQHGAFLRAHLDPALRERGEPLLPRRRQRVPDAFLRREHSALRRAQLGPCDAVRVRGTGKKKQH